MGRFFTCEQRYKHPSSPLTTQGTLRSYRMPTYLPRYLTQNWTYTFFLVRFFFLFFAFSIFSLTQNIISQRSSCIRWFDVSWTATVSYSCLFFFCKSFVFWLILTKSREIILKCGGGGGGNFFFFFREKGGCFFLFLFI